MIERFNFYDVYGNFLPGLAFLALIWLPIGIALHTWPGKEITSAIAVLAFAYVAGHILQTVFGNALPSKGKDSKGRRRYPSDYFLDPAELKFSKTVRQELQSSVKDVFHIELNADSPSEESLSEVSRARQDAFRLARFALLKARVETYSQQFQGLYALMRGLAGAFWMGSAYMLGWSMSSISDPYVHCLKLAGCVGLATAVTIAFWLAISQPRPSTRITLGRITLGSLLVALGVLGVWLGSQLVVLTPKLIFDFAVIAAVCLWSGATCFSSYKHFADEFAKATWLDFHSYRMTLSFPGNQSSKTTETASSQE